MQVRPRNVLVSAPGKLMVSGEYAVLEGAPAVVAAVDRRAFARIWAPGAPAAPAEASAAFAEAERVLGSVGSEPSLDVSELRAQGSKLGLGSSAAAAAAAAGLVYAQHGRDPAHSRREIFQAALRGHQAIAPNGSGADVAASVHGGFLRVQRRGVEVSVEPVTWPGQLRARVVWTQQEARTSAFLERVGKLAQARPDTHRTLMNDLASEAGRFAAALLAGDVGGVLASTAAYGRGMGELGKAAGVPILTDRLHEVAELARRSGGAAKPSGAGGGDVALALFPDADSENRFEDFCHERKFTLLLISLGAPGVRAEGDLHGEAV